MSDENRFSLLKLEKDVLKYVEYREKYKFYDIKLHKSYTQEERALNQENRDYWYSKYISKMAYLEKNYRKTNVYTDYHRQLENPYYNRNVCAEALPVPSAPIYDINNTYTQLPTAPSHEVIISTAINPTPIAEAVNVSFEADPKSVIIAEPIPE
jgi:hypothetical protein